MRELREVVLGRGDYIAGGARSLPFLDQDGARRRRPLVFGEVLPHPPSDPVLAGMFSGRAADPVEWSVMWKEIGADGVCLRTDGLAGGEAADLVRRISDRTGLPMVVDGDPAKDAGAGVDDSILVLIDAEQGMHAAAGTVLSVSDAREAFPDRANRMLLVEASFPEREGFDLIGSIRTASLEGDEGCDAPIIADVSSAYPEGEDPRGASMVEAEAALAAMVCGADALIVRGPGAADMARVYGEELADL